MYSIGVIAGTWSMHYQYCQTRLSLPTVSGACITSTHFNHVNTSQRHRCARGIVMSNAFTYR